MERRIALLLFVAALLIGAAVVFQTHEGGDKRASPPGTTATTTSTVLGNTATGTVKLPPKPTKQPPHLPRKHQHVPGTTPIPAGDIGSETDAEARRQLEAFLVTRPELEPYEESIWYSAHYSYSNVTPKGLAGLVWCVGFRVSACDRAADAAQR